MSNRLGDGGFQIVEIDRLGDEIERAAVHGGADLAHVAVGRNDDGRYRSLVLQQLLQQRKPVHSRHIDIGDHQIDGIAYLEHRQGFDAVAGKRKADLAMADLMAELLQNEGLQVRLVVDDEDMCCHAVRPTRASISVRSTRKSMGLVKKASAPPSSALRLVSASP